MTAISPTVLIVLDGWGHREAAPDNAISNANTPVWDALWQDRPRCLISASGRDVGLPDGQMGNSEVGHMNLGTGRVINQDFTRITKAIEDGSFAENAVAGIEPNRGRIEHNLYNSLMLVTALNPHIGYDKAAEVAKKAYKDDKTLRETIIDLGYMDGDDFDRLVQPDKMIRPQKRG